MKKIAKSYSPNVIGEPFFLCRHCTLILIGREGGLQEERDYTCISFPLGLFPSLVSCILSGCDRILLMWTNSLDVVMSMCLNTAQRNRVDVRVNRFVFDSTTCRVVVVHSDYQDRATVRPDRSATYGPYTPEHIYTSTRPGVLPTLSPPRAGPITNKYHHYGKACPFKAW